MESSLRRAENPRTNQLRSNRSLAFPPFEVRRSAFQSYRTGRCHIDRHRRPCWWFPAAATATSSSPSDDTTVPWGGVITESGMFRRSVVPRSPHAAMQMTIAHERTPLRWAMLRRGLRFRSNLVIDLAPSQPRTLDFTELFSKGSLSGQIPSTAADTPRSGTERGLRAPYKILEPCGSGGYPYRCSKNPPGILRLPARRCEHRIWAHLDSLIVSDQQSEGKGSDHALARGSL